MRFYKLKLEFCDKEIKSISSDGNRSYPWADGRLLKNIHLFNNREIYLDNFILDDILWDYFRLVDTYNDDDDWILLDSYRARRVKDAYVAVKGFLLSQRFKCLLEKFLIATPYRFYPSKLMFQGEKLDYFLFQLARPNLEGFDIQKSKFFEIDLKDDRHKLVLPNYKDWGSFIDAALKYKAYTHTRVSEYRVITIQSSKRIFLEASMNQYADIFYFPTFGSGIVVSEALKQAIEKQKITGVMFRELELVSFHF